MLHGITYGNAVDLFAVEFTSRECVLGGRSYPLGFFVAEALDKIPNIVEFRSSVAHMKEEQRQRRIQRGDGILGLRCSLTKADAAGI